MNLVNDLGNDLAFAILIDKKHAEKIDARRVREIIREIRRVLGKSDSADMDTDQAPLRQAANLSH